MPWSDGHQGRNEDPQYNGHCHDLGQEHEPMEKLPLRGEESRDIRDTRITSCCESVVQERRRPALKLQASIKFPSEEDDLEETILQLRLFKSLGYSDQEVAFGYCNQSIKLTHMFINLQPAVRTNLEEFFNVLRRRRPVDIGKAINEFFSRRQGHNEDEDDVMFYLQSRYNLMHGRAPGRLNCSALTDGEKCLIRHQFIVALKDEDIRLSLRVSKVKFEGLTSKARRLRIAREEECTRRQERKKKEEQGNLSFLNARAVGTNLQPCKVNMDVTKKTDKTFKNTSEDQVVKFKIFNLGKLKNPSRIPGIFDPEPDLSYEEGQTEGYVIFKSGNCARSTIKRMKSNPLVRRGVGKIQFWPITGSHDPKVIQNPILKSIQ